MAGDSLLIFTTPNCAKERTAVLAQHSTKCVCSQVEKKNRTITSQVRWSVMKQAGLT